MWSHAKQRGALGLTAGEGSGTLPSPALLRPCLSLFPPLMRREGRAGVAGLPFWRTAAGGGRQGPPTHQTVRPTATSPQVPQVTHEEGEDLPRVPPPEGTGSQPAGAV